MAKNIKYIITVDSKTAVQELQKVANQLNNLKGTTNIVVNANTQAASVAVQNLISQVNQLQAHINTLNNTPVAPGGGRGIPPIPPPLPPSQSPSQSPSNQPSQGSPGILQNLQNQRASLINDRALAQSTGEVKKLNDEIRKVDASINKLTGNQESRWARVTKNALTAISVYKAVNVALDALKTGFQEALDLEKFEVTLGELTGNSGKAMLKMGELRKFAVETPLEFGDIKDAAQTLLSYGLAQEKLIPTMKKIGDLAAGDSQKFKELSVVYGQVLTLGRLQAQDARQFATKGVSLYNELAKELNTDTSTIMKMMEKGQISFEMFDQALNKLTGTGGRFGGMMGALADSTSGRLAKLTDTFLMAMTDVVEAFMPYINKLIDGLVVIGEVITELSQNFAVLKNVIAENKELIIALLSTLFAWKVGMETINKITSIVENSMSSFSIIVKAATGSARDKAKALLLLRDAYRAATASAATMWATITLGITIILAATIALKTYLDALDTEARLKAVINDEISKELAKMEILFATMKDLNISSSERISAMEAINKEYAEYLPYLLSEASNLKDIEIAQKAVTKALHNQMIAKIQMRELEGIYAKKFKAQLDSGVALEDMKPADAAKEREINKILIERYQHANDIATAYESQVPMYENVNEEIEDLENLLRDTDEAKKLSIKVTNQLTHAEAKLAEAKRESYATRFGKDTQATESAKWQAEVNRLKNISEQQKILDRDRDKSEVKNRKRLEFLKSDEGKKNYVGPIINKKDYDSSISIMSEIREGMDKTAVKVKEDAGIIGKELGGTRFVTDEQAEKVREGTREYLKLMDEERRIRVLGLSMQRGIRTFYDKEEESKKNNINTTGKYIKIKDLEIGRVRANTQAMMDAMMAYDSETKAIKELIRIKEVGKMTEIDDQFYKAEKREAEMRNEVLERWRHTMDDLQKQYAKRLDQFNKTIEDAQTEMKDPNITQEKRIALSRILNQKLQNEELLKLEKNYLDEVVKVRTIHFEEAQKLEENLRIKSIERLKDFQIKYKEVIKDTNMENEQALQNNYIEFLRTSGGSFDDLIEANHMQYNKDMQMLRHNESKKTEEIAVNLARQKEIIKNIEKAQRDEIALEAKIAEQKMTTEDDNAARERLKTTIIEGNNTIQQKQLEYDILLKQLEKFTEDEKAIRRAWYNDATKLSMQQAEDTKNRNLENFAHEQSMTELRENKIIKVGKYTRELFRPTSKHPEIIKLGKVIDETKKELEKIQSDSAVNMALMAAKGATKAEVAKVNQDLKDKVTELEKKIEKTKEEKKSRATDIDREKLIAALDAIQMVSDASIEMINTSWDIQVQRLSKYIDIQTKKVDEARKKAEDSKRTGDAEILQLEEERLDKLNKKQEEYVKKQQALALIQMTINSMVAVTKAAVEAPYLAPVLIATTLAAIAAGFAMAREQAVSGIAGFKSGGYTGNGNDSDVAGPVHKREFVFNAKKTAEYRDILEAAHRGRLNLRDPLALADFLHGDGSLIRSIAASQLKLINFNHQSNDYINPLEEKLDSISFELQELRKTVRGQERLSVNIDQNGIAAIVSTIEGRRNGIRNLTK